MRLLGGEDRATTYNRPTTADVSSATINRTNFGRGRQQFAGAFTQLRVAPTGRLSATLSGRYDYWTNTRGVSEMTKYTNGIPGATAGGPIVDSHRGSFNPSLSARYDVTSQLSLRGATYKSFRAPGLNNLYRSFSTTTSITVANPTLAPETLTGGEAGADFKAGPVSLGATWFQYNTKGLIAAYRVPNAAAAPPAVIAVCGTTLANCPATVNFNTNGQDALSRGLEFVGGWRPAAMTTLDAAYTFTDSRYQATTTGDPTGVQLGAIPKHLATLGLSQQLTSRWSAYVAARHNAAMFLDVNQTIRQPAFTLLNLSTSYQLAPRWELYGAAVNVTDVHYSDNATTSAAGEILGQLRAFTSGLRVRF
jgi:outer membrane receptor protein involved in Fe transport